MEYYSAIKSMKQCHLQSMDGSKDYHTKWSKARQKDKILYDITYM